MIKKCNYSEKEDRVILRCIENHPENISLATRLAAKKLNRSPLGVSQRYYNILSKRNACFLTISKKKNFMNRKTIYDSSQVVENPKGLWDKIVDTLKHFLHE